MLLTWHDTLVYSTTLSSRDNESCRSRRRCCCWSRPKTSLVFCLLVITIVCSFNVQHAIPSKISQYVSSHLFCNPLWHPRAPLRNAKPVWFGVLQGTAVVCYTPHHSRVFDHKWISKSYPISRHHETCSIKQHLVQLRLWEIRRVLRIEYLQSWISRRSFMIML